MDFERLKLGFIGAGNMAFAIIKGIVTNGIVKVENVLASAPTITNLDKIKDLGCKITHCNADVLKQCNVVVLCVKPFKITEALEGLEKLWRPDHIAISVISGVKIKTFYNTYISPTVKMIRVMPNLPALVQSGVFAYSISPRNPSTDNYLRLLSEHLFGKLGLCAEVSEDLLDAVCGLSGSGPAYVFTVIQAMSDGAVKMGLPRQLATKMAAQTVMGASKMVLETGKHPDMLRDEVCSPSGTTICGIHALEKAGVRGAFMDAVEAATTRATAQGDAQK